MRIGTRQHNWLRSIAEEGGTWHPGCGFHWGGYRSSIVLCQSLEKHGLLKQTSTTYGRERFTITEAGRALIAPEIAADKARRAAWQKLRQDEHNAEQLAREQRHALTLEAITLAQKMRALDCAAPIEVLETTGQRLAFLVLELLGKEG